MGNERSIGAARIGLLLDDIFNEMEAAHRQADHVQLFAQDRDVKGINRQLIFMTGCLERATGAISEIMTIANDSAANEPTAIKNGGAK